MAIFINNKNIGNVFTNGKTIVSGYINNKVVFEKNILPSIQGEWIDAGFFTWKDVNQNSLSITESGKQQATLPDVEDGEQLISGESLFANSVIVSAPIFIATNIANFSSMFRNCSSLTTIPQLDTSKGTFFFSMIEGCSKLTTIPQFDTTNGTNFGQMFRSCSSLVTIPQLDTSKGTKFGSMFDGCSSLVTTGLLDVSKSTDFSGTFSNCSKLTNTKVMGIKANISFANSPLLTQESIEYLIDNAQTVTGQTITLHATALAKVTAEYKQKATNKGWTVK